MGKNDKSQCKNCTELNQKCDGKKSDNHKKSCDGK